jgi:hypothetical protein
VNAKAAAMGAKTALLALCFLMGSKPVAGKWNRKAPAAALKSVSHFLQAMNESAAISGALRCAFCNQNLLDKIQNATMATLEESVDGLAGLTHSLAHNIAQARISTDSGFLNPSNISSSYINISSSDTNISTGTCDATVSIREADTLKALKDIAGELTDHDSSFARNDSSEAHCPRTTVNASAVATRADDLLHRIQTTILPLLGELRNATEVALHQTLLMLCGVQFDSFVNPQSYQIKMDPTVLSAAQPLCNLTNTLFQLYQDAGDLQVTKECEDFLPAKLAIRQLLTSLQPVHALCLPERNESAPAKVDCAASRVLTLCESVCGLSPNMCPAECDDGKPLSGFIMHTALFFQHRVVFEEGGFNPFNMSKEVDRGNRTLLYDKDLLKVCN